MIELKKGNMLAVDTEALVNTVNCVGIMGRGVALQFRTAFPDNFTFYESACKRGEVRPGKMLVFETHQITNPRYIINFPTKRHWKGKSNIQDIKSGLLSLVAEIKNLGIRSIALPPLGCGLGGLLWNDVRPLIEKAMSTIPEVEVIQFEPSDIPRESPALRARKAPVLTAGRAALVGLMRRYLAALMDPTISLLEVHKLMYFIQEAGEPLKLNYVKAPFGPYAQNLRHVLHVMNGYWISGFAEGSDEPEKQISLVPDAVSAVDKFLADNQETRTRFDKVVDLVDGFESPFGLELLATVHWVGTRENAKTKEQVVTHTYAWNDRKRRFSKEQIELAFRVLGSKGWLTKAPVGSRHEN